MQIKGKEDITGALTRQSVDGHVPPSIPAGKRRLRDEEQETFLYVHCTSEDQIQQISVQLDRKPIFRIRTRVLSSTYGWPLRHFCTLGELLRVLRDAIRGKDWSCTLSDSDLIGYPGHEHLYANGVLHRDIGPGNIIIAHDFRSEINPKSSSGRIIDLDHARAGEKCDDILVPELKEREGHDKPMGSTERQDLTERLTISLNGPEPETTDLKIKDDIILQAFKVSDSRSRYGQVYNYAQMALEHAARFPPCPQDNFFSCETLDWHQVWSFYLPQHLINILDQVSKSFDYRRAEDESDQGSRTVCIAVFYSLSNSLTDGMDRVHPLTPAPRFYRMNPIFLKYHGKCITMLCTT